MAGNGVQYNIQVQAGNSKSELSAIIGLLGESVTATNAVQGVMSQFGTAATSHLSNIEAAVSQLANDFKTQLKPAVSELPPALDEAAEGGERLVDTLEKAGQTAFSISNLQNAISGLVSDLNNAVQPGIDLNSSLAEMQAVTQSSDAQMQAFSDTARDNAKAFGVDAAKGLEGYKTYIASLGPAIASNKPAIDSLAQDAFILSKQMKGDVAGAAGLLTTAMQQYGVSMDDPIEASKTAAAMMNIMSSAAQAGSAELPDLKAGLEQSGMMAKTANVSFAETNAMLEVLSNSGKRGAEGGVALRNAMSILSEGETLPPKTQELLQAAGVNIQELADKSLTFAQRLELLKPIANDTAVMTQLFGRENVSAGVALVNNTSAITAMTGSIVGSNSATEMANTIMGSYEEKQNRITSAIKDFGISIFNASQDYLPFINLGMGTLSVLGNLGQAMNLFSVLSKTKMVEGIMASVTGLGTWIGSTISATAAQWGLNVAMDANPIGLVVVAVAAAVGAMALLIHYWDDIKAAIEKFATWVWNHSPFKFLIDITDKVFPGFKSAMEDLWNWIKDKIDALFGWIGDLWNGIKGMFSSGMNDLADMMSTPLPSPKIGLDTKDINDINSQLGYTLINPTTAFPGLSMPGVTADVFKANAEQAKLLKSNDKAPKNVGGASSKNISSGGSRPTTINLTIHKLQDQIVVHTTNLQAGAKDAANQIIEELLAVLNSVNAKAAGIGG